MGLTRESSVVEVPTWLSSFLRTPGQMTMCGVDLVNGIRMQVFASKCSLCLPTHLYPAGFPSENMYVCMLHLHMSIEELPDGLQLPAPVTSF